MLFSGMMRMQNQETATATVVGTTVMVLETAALATKVMVPMLVLLEMPVVEMETMVVDLVEMATVVGMATVADLVVVVDQGDLVVVVDQEVSDLVVVVDQEVPDQVEHLLVQEVPESVLMVVVITISLHPIAPKMEYMVSSMANLLAVYNRNYGGVKWKQRSQCFGDTLPKAKESSCWHTGMKDRWPR
jgi:hypothetical protein